MDFRILSDFHPTGDQPQAIKEIVSQFENNDSFVTLQGVTGSGKTFTMANAVEQLQRPTLVLAHNKTLAAQLYSEFKQFFPNNAVEYFVSYYDYYQPEAYIPTSGTYIEKDLSINEEMKNFALALLPHFFLEEETCWSWLQFLVYMVLEIQLNLKKNVIDLNRT